MDESKIFLMDMSGSNTFFGASGYSLDQDTLKKIISAENGNTILTDALVITKTVSSRVSHWCYLSVTPRATFDNYYTLQRNFVYAAIGTCVLFSLLLAMLLAKRQYSPILRIYEKLIGNSCSHVSSKGENEYKVIESSVTQLITNLENRNYQLLEKQEQLRSHILMRILRNSSICEKGLQRFREDYGIHFKHSGFVVLTIIFDHISHPLNEEDAEGAGIEKAINRLIATAVAGALSPMFDCSFAMDEDQFACIVNAEPHQLTEAVFRESVQKAYEYLKNKLQIEATIAVGSLQERMSALSQSYYDAVTCLEYAQMTGDSGRVVYCQDLKLLPRIDMQYEHRLQQQKNFQYQMSLENYADALKTLVNIIESYERESPKSPARWRLQLAFIESILSFTLSDSRIFCDAGFTGSYLAHLDALRDAHSTQELMTVLKRIFNEIQHWSDKNMVPTSTIISNVLAYVQNNFASSDISIGNIADQFNVSISYISRQFKHSYGMGLLDYIHKLRINEAKKLLEDKALTIKEIAFRVGYINSLTMSRSFKRYEGVLPSEYRMLHKSDDLE
jgi:AraC-like DNA-binding protein